MYAVNQGRMSCPCPISWSMAAMLCDVVVAVVVRGSPRAIPLVILTTRKAIHGFYEYGAPLGRPSGNRSSAIILYCIKRFDWLEEEKTTTIPSSIHRDGKRLMGFKSDSILK